MSIPYLNFLLFCAMLLYCFGYMEIHFTCPHILITNLAETILVIKNNTVMQEYSYPNVHIIIFKPVSNFAGFGSFTPT